MSRIEPRLAASKVSKCLTYCLSLSDPGLERCVTGALVNPQHMIPEAPPGATLRQLSGKQSLGTAGRGPPDNNNKTINLRSKLSMDSFMVYSVNQ